MGREGRDRNSQASLVDELGRRSMSLIEGQPRAVSMFSPIETEGPYDFD